MSSFAQNLAKGIKGRLGSMFHSPYKEVNLNWLTLKYYKHLPVGTPKTHRLLGKQLHFTAPFELLHALEEIFIDKIYKQEFTTSHPYIIDCGANIGISVIYFKYLYPNAEIVAFEPDENNFNLLSKNVSSFELSDVEVRKEAVWKENTTLNFSSEGSMSSKIEVSGSAGTNLVKAIRLRDMLVKRVDFLKIDIEGAEYEVIKDCSESLQQVNNLFIEYHGSFSQNHQLTEILTIIEKQGFHYYIKEATQVYHTPFLRNKAEKMLYDVQLNIFCFRIQ